MTAIPKNNYMFYRYRENYQSSFEFVRNSSLPLLLYSNTQILIPTGNRAYLLMRLSARI